MSAYDPKRKSAGAFAMDAQDRRALKPAGKQSFCYTISQQFGFGVQLGNAKSSFYWTIPK
jgi:hypothetical protein